MDTIFMNSKSKEASDPQSSETSNLQTITQSYR